MLIVKELRKRFICKSQCLLKILAHWRAWETFWQDRLHTFQVLARPDSNFSHPLFSGTGKMTQGKRLLLLVQEQEFFSPSFTVVLIKWTNIFRPAYFTPRHWREGVISLSGQRAEWKESIRWGRRGTETREIEGIQLCVSLSEFREITTDRWEGRLKNIKKL